jgi:hypothetical protein
LVRFYGENIRGSLFTGFLTLGGFLLSLKTFIIVKMKENVYDDERYIDGFDCYVFDFSIKLNQQSKLFFISTSENINSDTENTAIKTHILVATQFSNNPRLNCNTEVMIHERIDQNNKWLRFCNGEIKNNLDC